MSYVENGDMVWVGFTPTDDPSGVFRSLKDAALRNLEDRDEEGVHCEWVRGFPLDGRITQDGEWVLLPGDRAEAEDRLAVAQSGLEAARVAYEQALTQASRAQAVVDAMVEYETGHANG